MYDMLHETRAYQELIREGVEKGLEKGLAQGLEQGLEQGRLERMRETRETLDEVILERFPKIMWMVKGPLSSIHDVKILRHLIVKMSTVQNAEEALQYIRDLTAQSEQ